MSNPRVYYEFVFCSKNNPANCDASTFKTQIETQSKGKHPTFADIIDTPRIKPYGMYVSYIFRAIIFEKNQILFTLFE